MAPKKASNTARQQQMQHPQHPPQQSAQQLISEHGPAPPSVFRSSPIPIGPTSGSHSPHSGAVGMTPAGSSNQAARILFGSQDPGHPPQHGVLAASSPTSRRAFEAQHPKSQSSKSLELSNSSAEAHAVGLHPSSRAGRGKEPATPRTPSPIPPLGALHLTPGTPHPSPPAQGRGGGRPPLPSSSAPRPGAVAGGRRTPQGSGRGVPSAPARPPPQEQMHVRFENGEWRRDAAAHQQQRAPTSGGGAVQNRRSQPASGMEAMFTAGRSDSGMLREDQTRRARVQNWVENYDPGANHRRTNPMDRLENIEPRGIRKEMRGPHS